MPITQPLREKHFPALDGLRGLAALMVVAHHSAFDYIRTNTFDKAYFRATGLLWVGVDLFFVLSGFLITNILLDTKRSSNYFRAFYGRRFVRIFPLYYAFLAIVYLLVPLLGGTLGPRLLSPEFWEWTYTSNFYVALYHWPDWMVSHLWTLAIEEQFYLLWPLVIFIAGERRLKKGIIAVLLAFPLVRAICIGFSLPANFVFTFTLTHIDGLLLGGFISLLYRAGSIEKFAQASKLQRVLDWAVSGVVILFIIIYCFGLRNDQFVFSFASWPLLLQSIGFSVISLVFAYAVLRSVSPIPNLLQRCLSLPQLRSIGKYSYALYVLHMPVCAWAGHHFPVPTFLMNLSSRWSWAYSVYIIVIQFTLSIAAAVISWNILEKHFLKLKKYFPYKATVYQKEGLGELGITEAIS